MSKDKYFGDHSIDSKAFSITSDGGLTITESGVASPISIASGNSVDLTLGDYSGSEKLRVKDSLGVEQVSVDSDGNIICNTLTLGQIFASGGSLSLDAMTLDGLTVNEINVGGGYGSTGSTLSSTGNISMDGSLTVDGEVLLLRDGVGAKRRKKWIGSTVLMSSKYSPSNDWTVRSLISGSSGGLALDDNGSAFCYFPINDLPRGAHIQNIQLYGYFHETWSSIGNAGISIRLFRSSGTLAPNDTELGNDAWSESTTSAAQKPGFITLQFDADHIVTGASHYIQVFVNNGGTAECINIHSITLNYAISNLTPDIY